MVNGFVAHGEELPETEAEAEVEEELRALTYQAALLEAITKGTYILNEDDLPNEYKELLHNRAYIIDREELSETDSGTPKIYYIAADKVQGLIIPSRTLFIKSELDDSYYRFTDDGDKWTDWITLPDGLSHTYFTQELCRFAEVQVYSEKTGTVITLRATR